jgi:DedD protein
MDKVLKQRLVGASILIALAVIFLPMLFDDGREDRIEQRELALDVPERSEGDRRIRRLSLDPAEARRPGSDAQAEPPAASGDAESRPESGDDAAARPVPRPDAEPDTDAGDDRDRTGELAVPGQDAADDEPTTEPEMLSAERESEAEAETPADSGADDVSVAETDTEGSETVASESGGGWVVQVAVFGNADTAASIRERLQELGHEVMVDVIVRDQTELHRLRTGPYASESDAGRARGQIAATVSGVEPVVRELDATAGSQDRQGMAVQVGSFASRNNAERLVGQLAQAGYDAFMHGEVSGGRTIWRVRVGTYETRDEADRLLKTLTEEEGLQGIVVSHP